ncbi:YegP family protein [Lutibacter citreus]|uniref:YegP family protein n=1 Tax=Lutibacter citreus TaxID=2138210 RepID=UPI000DBE2051|nr:YegP family protein [Lutibacter citreus]
MAKFEIFKDKKEEFRFRLKAGNGQIILVSEGYKIKASCLNGIESVRENSQDDSKFEKLIAKNGKPHFNLKASNGQVIGVSEIYSSMITMNNGINSIKKNAVKAIIVEV